MAAPRGSPARNQLRPE